MTSNIKINRNKGSGRCGFIAFITISILSMLFLTAVLVNQENTVQILNLVYLKTLRGEATTNALFCLNKALIELTHDYFYSANVDESEMLADKDDLCLIQLVSAPDKVNESIRHITVTGKSSALAHATVARIDAIVLLKYQEINLISATTTF